MKGKELEAFLIARAAANNEPPPLMRKGLIREKTKIVEDSSINKLDNSERSNKEEDEEDH